MSVLETIKSKTADYEIDPVRDPDAFYLCVEIDYPKEDHVARMTEHNAWHFFAWVIEILTYNQVSGSVTVLDPLAEDLAVIDLDFTQGPISVIGTYTDGTFKEATGRTFYLAEKQLPKDGLIHVG